MNTLIKNVCTYPASQFFQKLNSFTPGLVVDILQPRYNFNYTCSRWQEQYLSGSFLRLLARIMSSLMLQTWQHSVVFALGSSKKIAQSSGFTSMSDFAQMEEDVGPVILMNKFSVNPEEFDQFLKGWATEAEKFKEQPGFISTQLHKGIGESGTFINYAVWESAEHFKRAVNKVMDPQDRMSAYPPSTVASPHLFKKVAVPGICVK